MVETIFQLLWLKPSLRVSLLSYCFHLNMRRLINIKVAKLYKIPATTPPPPPPPPKKKQHGLVYLCDRRFQRTLPSLLSKQTNEKKNNINPLKHHRQPRFFHLNNHSTFLFSFLKYSDKVDFAIY